MLNQSSTARASDFHAEKVGSFVSRLMALSMALYRACFICGRRCPWWSRQLRLTLIVISDIKPIIYSFCLHVYILVYCSLPPTLPLHWPMSCLCHLNCLGSLSLLSFVDLSLQVCCSFSPLPLIACRGGICIACFAFPATPGRLPVCLFLHIGILSSVLTIVILGPCYSLNYFTLSSLQIKECGCHPRSVML